MQDTAVHTVDRPWQPAPGYPAGTEYKILRRSDEGDVRAAILKLPAGFAMERHTHVVPEHHYVLEGEVRVGEAIDGVGTYRRIAAHAEHGPFRSRDGAMVLVIWED